MKNEKIVSKYELNQVKYGDLLAKFTELGIPEIWKPGSKKLSMIEKAIEKLNIKNSLEAKGLEQAEVEKELEIIEEKKEKAIQAEKLEQAKQVEAKDRKIVKEVVESKLSKQQIENNIAIINKNLINVIPSHRTILLKKKELLEQMLKDS